MQYRGKLTVDWCKSLLTVRVRAHAGACLVNFFDSNEIASLSTMVEPLVRALFAAFHSGPLYMQEQAFASMCMCILT